MSEQIYSGRWTDWSYGPVLGDHVTISSRTATYLISFIATFDVWVGSAAWNLLAFVAHQYFTIREPRNGAIHQLQVALRNSSTPMAFVERSVFIAWTWRNISPKAAARALVLSIFPILLAALFVAAGIGSSRIASTTGDVLLTGGDCGLVNPNISSASQELLVQLSQEYQDGIRISLSNAYAQECYRNPLDPQNIQVINSDTSRSSCGGYTKSSFAFTNITIASCPFGDTCATSDVLELDTGYLDSHHDFGLNQSPENRVKYRKVTTCSPLQSIGFSENAFKPVKGFEYLGDISVYSYGNNSYQPTRFGFAQGLPYADSTFVYSEYTYNASETAYYLMKVFLSLIASTMQVGGSGPLYTPVPRISPDPARPMSLVFLANRAFYQEAVNDTWFKATSPLNIVANGNIENTFYQADSLGSVLGCVEQVQICNPNLQATRACTDLDTWHLWGDYVGYLGGKTPQALLDIGLNSMQLTTAMMLQDASLSGTVWNVIDQLGDRSLDASNYISRQELYWSPGLGNNQWQIEAANWFSIGLAHIQRLFISNYRTPSTKVLLDYFEPWPANATEEQHNFCDSQKVRSSEYTTFSVLGLGLNFGIGGFILICGHLLPIVVPWLQGKKAKTSFAREQWLNNSMLQLMRVSYQALNLGTWTGAEDTVPTTVTDEDFVAPSLAATLKEAHKAYMDLERGSISKTADTYEMPLLLSQSD